MDGSRAGMKHVELLSGAWHGDQPLTITFPSSWDVCVVDERLQVALTPEQMRARLLQPIGTPPLAQLASGRRRAAIIIDDITRPTPTAQLLPLVMEELARGGIQPRAVTIVIATGAHRYDMDEMQNKKIGSGLSNEVTVVAHHSGGDVVSLGISPNGTPVTVNQAAMNCDLKIGLGGIYPHPVAGFSGGSKILAPGICGTETVRHLHHCFEGAGRRGGTLESAFRRELDAVATMAGLDFVVNVVLNAKREIAGLFAGDKILAHREGARVAAESYRVRAIPDADIVVTNTYPFDTSLYFMPRGFWPLETGRKGASKVVIGDGSVGRGESELKPPGQPLWRRVQRRLGTLQVSQGLRQFRVELEAVQKMFKEQRLEFLTLCPGIRDEDLHGSFPRARSFSRWDGLREALEQRHPRLPVKVAVYPTAPLQLPIEDGDRR